MLIRQTVDAGSLIDGSPWGTYQKLLTALAAIAVIFDGFDIQILAFAIPSLMQDWKVARADFGPVLAIGLAGMALGSPAAGYIGDRFGRRPALIGCVALFGLATVATAFIQGLAGLSALRFLTGLGAGGAVPNASALAAEFAPLRKRAAAVKLTIVCIPLGGMLGGLIAAQVLPTLGWRALYLIGGSAPLLFAAALWWLLPESPRFLVRKPAAWPQLTALLRRMGHKVVNGAVFEDRLEEKAGVAHVSIGSLFSRSLARDTIGLWIAFFFCLQGVYLVFGWLPSMLTAAGYGLATASSGLAVYNFGGVLGVLLWTVLTSLVGSRQPMIWGAIGAGAAALAMTAIPPGALPLIAGIGVHGLLANAVQTSMFALGAHVYPTSVRASGVAYAASVGRIGAILTSLFGAAIIQRGSSTYWISLSICMFLAAAGLYWVRRHVPASDDGPR
jgi:AAHS family 4-hydroxybenzoate transporter-like MFS transporter